MTKVAFEILKGIAYSTTGVVWFSFAIISYASQFFLDKYLSTSLWGFELKYYIYLALLISSLGVFFSFISVLRQEVSKNNDKSLEEDNLNNNLTVGIHEQLINQDGKLDEEELFRLKIQGDRNYLQDIQIITTVLKNLKRKNISLLDIGCGDGFVTISRMEQFNNITKVVGIDKNNEAINKANRNNPDNDKYEFRTYDIESTDFTQIGELSGKKDNKFDIVFCSLVLPHIQNPYQLVTKIKTILNPGGMVIFRSSDDGTKICYPDSDTLDQILEYTYKIPGISDRHNARKVLAYLKSSDFTDIESSYDVIDTIGKTTEERKKLFHKSFSFRKKYLTKTMLKDVKIDFTKKEFDKLLSKLENNFIDPSFYYMEISYLFIAKRK